MRFGLGCVVLCWTILPAAAQGSGPVAPSTLSCEGLLLSNGFTLRMLGPQDQALIWQLFDEPSIKQWLEDDPSEGLSAALKSQWQWLTLSRNVKFRMAIVGIFSTEGHLAGVVTLESVNQQPTLVGFSVSEDYRRKGLAREAVSAVLDQLFTETDLFFIQSRVHKDNLTSRQFLQGLGFSESSAVVNAHGMQVFSMKRPHWLRRRQGS